MSYLVAFIFLIKSVARSLVEYKGVKQSWILQNSEEGGFGERKSNTA